MQWFKFDDERVTKARKKEVFENTYGGETQRVITGYMGKKMVTSYPKTANACIHFMLHFSFYVLLFAKNPMACIITLTS